MDLKQKLRIVSYNCPSVKNSVGTIKSLYESNDIIMLQEHWLLPDDIPFLSSIIPEFMASGKSPVNVEAGVLQ